MTAQAVAALREPRIPENALHSEASCRWRRAPLFLHLRASPSMSAADRFGLPAERRSSKKA
jgi:hypothetical protein